MVDSFVRKLVEDERQALLDGLHVDPWMVDQLRLNPTYVSWGPDEGCMVVNGDGWDSSLGFDSWPACDLCLNDLNEVVNFYFFLHRATSPCPTCTLDGEAQGSGYNPETARLAASFYQSSCPPGVRAWGNQITGDEVRMLLVERRLWEWRGQDPERVVDEVNARQSRGLVHDAINLHLLIEHRAKRLGIYGLCPTCNGVGAAWAEDLGHLGLCLWLLHPRKGASRGVEVKDVRQEDLPAVYAFLHQAAERNAQRFVAVPRPSAK